MQISNIVWNIVDKQSVKVNGSMVVAKLSLCIGKVFHYLFNFSHKP
jgi:hypothetical protein